MFDQMPYHLRNIQYHLASSWNRIWIGVYFSQMNTLEMAVINWLPKNLYLLVNAWRKRNKKKCLKHTTWQVALIMFHEGLKVKRTLIKKIEKEDEELRGCMKWLKIVWLTYLAFSKWLWTASCFESEPKYRKLTLRHCVPIFSKHL